MNKIFDLPLTLLAVSIIWLFYMEGELKTLPIILILFYIGWRTKSNIY